VKRHVLQTISYCAAVILLGMNMPHLKPPFVILVVTADTSPLHGCLNLESVRSGTDER
jgi:hypothetical protein